MDQPKSPTDPLEQIKANVQNVVEREEKFKVFKTLVGDPFLEELHHLLQKYQIGILVETVIYSDGDKLQMSTRNTLLDQSDVSKNQSL